MFSPVTVLGAGSWGTALAWLLGDKGVPVRLWYRSEEQAAAVGAARQNQRYLPGLPLPEAVAPTADFPGALAGAGTVVVAVPTGGVREILRRAGRLVGPEASFVLAAKGLERESGLSLTQVAREELGDAAAGRVAVL